MDPAMQKMIDNLEKNTGKSLTYWTELVQKSGIEKHGVVVKMLKEDHSLGHGYANMIVHLAKESAAFSQDDQDLVSAQYSGKETLKLIYDIIIEKTRHFGPDIEISPKKNAVSLRRKRQFALIQPTTKTRIDLGLKYNNRPYSGRLETSGPFGTMCTHRVQLTDSAQVDDELIHWIKEAYDEAG
jgi:predicted transport protein